MKIVSFIFEYQRKDYVPATLRLLQWASFLNHFLLFCNHRKLLSVITYYPIEMISFKDRDGVIELYPIGSLSRSMIAYLNALYTIRKCMLIRQTLCECVYKALCLEELTFKIDKDKSVRNKSCLNPFSASLNELLTLGNSWRKVILHSCRNWELISRCKHSVKILLLCDIYSIVYSIAKGSVQY